ncbi:unnamed protein product [Adineta ricciae]|uniref:Uncharacterized protein n=1 Tax=Adineta ricciae TaxID=249248 RepID=A0A813X3B2_ADIRI|nr:unnamed protein product [Adineta ricciae]
MASASSATAIKTTDIEHETPEEVSKNIDESKKSSIVLRLDEKEEKDEVLYCGRRQAPHEQRTDLSPHAIQKRSITPLSALPIRARSTLNKEKIILTSSSASQARPYEEVLVVQPDVDASGGISSKPTDGSSVSMTGSK